MARLLCWGLVSHGWQELAHRWRLNKQTNKLWPSFVHRLTRTSSIFLVDGTAMKCYATSMSKPNLLCTISHAKCSAVAISHCYPAPKCPCSNSSTHICYMLLHNYTISTHCQQQALQPPPSQQHLATTQCSWHATKPHQARRQGDVACSHCKSVITTKSYVS